MKIIHTSDWHLGAFLEDVSRIDEQAAFIDELAAIAEEQQADMILVAGDIYDTMNPPAAAEALFYQAIKKLTNKKRPVILISGNHDSPNRLCAPNPVLYDMGCVLLGRPGMVVETGDYGFYKIPEAGAGYFETEITHSGERAIIITMPFPSEKRLNILFSHNQNETELQKSFSDKIGDIFEDLSHKYRADTINLAVGHFHITGGASSGSERDIQYGGSYAVHSAALPKDADYIAMGHLHKPQKIANMDNGFYSGSPIKYSLNEINYKKCIYLIEKRINQPIRIDEIPLTDYKPIEEWNAASIEEALTLCETNQNKNCWVYLNITSHRPIYRSEFKQLLSFNKDIVRITLSVSGNIQEIVVKEAERRSVMDEFIDFYIETNKTEPEKELTDLFLKILSEDDTDLT